jgi:hypothetical protein
MLWSLHENVVGMILFGWSAMDCPPPLPTGLNVTGGRESRIWPATVWREEGRKESMLRHSRRSFNPSCHSTPRWPTFSFVRLAKRRAERWGSSGCRECVLGENERMKGRKENEGKERKESTNSCFFFSFSIVIHF